MKIIKIIKTQWLTNIIQIGDLNFRYINFASYSNGDMIVETTAFPASPARMFFGLQSNGHPFFEGNNHFSIDVKEMPKNVDKSRFEAENCIVTINEGAHKGKEYLVSFSMNSKFTELFNFKEKTIKQKKNI